ncbi:hypothetical protein [Photobacterium leiognathi]|uniref:hypothetical protein n=1 Tax=Photobacterium leiognathi TaxID=553611 RepID=UPI0034E61325
MVKISDTRLINATAVMNLEEQGIDRNDPLAMQRVAKEAAEKQKLSFLLQQADVNLPYVTASARNRS